MRLSPARSLLSSLLPAALVAAGLAAGAPAEAASPDVVISQVYGGGGNSGATYRNDFIELFNRGASAVDLTGWSVQYASSGGSTWQRTNLSGTLQPGQYYLVQEAQGTGGTVSLPAPDATGAIAMSATSGKVALVTSQTLLTCGATAGSCLPKAAIRDFVGFGSSANNFEGAAPTATLSNTTAAARRGGGCTDSDDNAADFTIGAPVPHNTASPLAPCNNEPVVVTCGGPLVTTEGAPASQPVSATDADGTVFSLAITGVTPAAAGISLANLMVAPSIGGTATADVAVDGTVAVGSYQVQVTGTNLDSPVPQTGSCTLTVTVVPPVTPIYAIQGSGATSPYVGSLRRTTGVVTVLLGSGFFLQDPVGDGDPATSDGLFVFTSSAVTRTLNPGDVIEVTGTVSEFRSSTRPRDLPLTELSGAVTVVKTGTAPVPDPVAIADRPDVVLSPDGIDGFEALEGMRIVLPSPRAVGPTNSFGELWVVAEGDAGNTTPGGNILVRPLGGDQVDYNPERILIDDEARRPGGTGSGLRYNNPQVQVTTGVAATGDVVGALDYQFSNYRVQADQTLSEVFASPVPTGPVAHLRAPQPYEGRIATFNVENLFDCVDAPGKDDDHPTCSAADRVALDAKLGKLAAIFQQELGSPDIVIVEEAENSLVLTGDAQGFVPGTTIPALLPRLAGHHDAVSFDASDVRGIEVAFVYNTDRVTLHDAFLGTAVLPDSGGVFDGSVFRAGREPLVGFFTLDGVDLILIGNHLKSKGGPQFTGDPADEPGDDPLYGVAQPAVRWTEILRHPQADYVRQLADLLRAANPGKALAIGGDMNDFSFPEPEEGTDTLARIRGNDLVDAADLLPEATRYTYVFDGNSQVLDHLLLDPALAGRLTDQAVAHINADYPASFGGNAALTVRASDHDPLVAYLCSDTTPPALSVAVTPGSLWPPNHRLVRVSATVTASDDADPAVAVTLLSATSSEPDSGVTEGDLPGDVNVVDDHTFDLRAERADEGPGRVYTLTYRATDACGNVTEASATVTVPHDRR